MKWTRRDETMEWKIIKGVNDKYPEQEQVVVGLWEQGDIIACLCYYDHETKQWFDADPNSDGGETCAPDYWIELPD